MPNEFQQQQIMRILEKFTFDALSNLKTKTVAVSKLIWITTADFTKGVFTNSEAVGDILRPAGINDLNDDFDYETPANYTPSDGAKIEVSSGSARLKALSGSSTDFPFTVPSNFTLSDATKIQILGGKAILRATGIVGHWFLNESAETS